MPYTCWIIEWKKSGFLKSIHHQKKQTEGNQPFTINKLVMTWLDQWDQGDDKCESIVDFGE
jgi:hypothetical protein